MTALPLPRGPQDLHVTQVLTRSAPDRYPVGRPSSTVLRLASLQDPRGVGSLVDDACRRLGTDRRTWVAFSLFHAAADALLAPGLAGLLLGADGALVTDLHGTRLGLGPDGRIAAVWPRTVRLPLPAGPRRPPRVAPGTAAGSKADAVAAVAHHAATGLEGLVEGFGPHVRMGRRAFAAAAGIMLAQRADQLDVVLQPRVRTGGGNPASPDRQAARQVVAQLVAHAAPWLRPARYVALDGTPGTVPTATVCCGWFRIGDGGACTGCPRTGRKETSPVSVG